MILDRNDAESSLDPTIGSIEAVDVPLTVVIICGGKVLSNAMADNLSLSPMDLAKSGKSFVISLSAGKLFIRTSKGSFPVCLAMCSIMFSIIARPSVVPGALHQVLDGESVIAFFELMVNVPWS